MSIRPQSPRNRVWAFLSRVHKLIYSFTTIHRKNKADTSYFTIQIFVTMCHFQRVKLEYTEQRKTTNVAVSLAVYLLGGLCFWVTRRDKTRRDVAESAFRKLKLHQFQNPAATVPGGHESSFPTLTTTFWIWGWWKRWAEKQTRHRGVSLLSLMDALCLLWSTLKQLLSRHLVVNSVFLYCIIVDEMIWHTSSFSCAQLWACEDLHWLHH